MLGRSTANQQLYYPEDRGKRLRLSLEGLRSKLRNRLNVILSLVPLEYNTLVLTGKMSVGVYLITYEVLRKDFPGRFLTVKQSDGYHAITITDTQLELSL